MPCFLTGEAVARSIAKTNAVPALRFSHQAGHVMAALYSAEKEELLSQTFAAFHVSGGTTEMLLVEPGMKITKIGGTVDLTAGQAIDRIGVMLGLKFPCGPALEALAKEGNVRRDKICVNGLTCNLSGLENKVQQYFSAGHTPAQTAKYALNSIACAVYKATENALKLYPGLEVVFSGGVASNSLLRQAVAPLDPIFAEPKFSTDNAMGVAVLTHRMMEE